MGLYCIRTNNLSSLYEYISIIYENNGSTPSNYLQAISMQPRFWSTPTTYTIATNIHVMGRGKPDFHSLLEHNLDSYINCWKEYWVSFGSMMALNIILRTNLNQKFKLIDSDSNFLFEPIYFSCSIQFRTIFIFELLT